MFHREEDCAYRLTDGGNKIGSAVIDMSFCAEKGLVQPISSGQSGDGEAYLRSGLAEFATPHILGKEVVRQASGNTVFTHKGFAQSPSIQRTQHGVNHVPDQ